MQVCPRKGIACLAGAFVACILTTPVYASDCSPFNYTRKPVTDFAFPASAPNQFAISESEGTDPVSWELKPAPLRPQVETLLREQWGVQNIVWYAERGHFWPTNYTLVAPTWDLLLSKVLSPYQLRVKLHSNHTAVIEYLPGVESAQ